VFVFRHRGPLQAAAQAVFVCEKASQRFRSGFQIWEAEALDLLQTRVRFWSIAEKNGAEAAQSDDRNCRKNPADARGFLRYLWSFLCAALTLAKVMLGRAQYTFAISRASLDNPSSGCKLPQSYPKATPKLPQSYTRAMLAGHRYNHASRKFDARAAADRFVQCFRECRPAQPRPRSSSREVVRPLAYSGDDCNRLLSMNGITLHVRHNHLLRKSLFQA
jgi:hypothetical protein